MSRYAEQTTVPVEKSKAEIERILLQHGASCFMSGWDTDRAYIAFEMQGRRVRFLLPIPDRQDPDFLFTPGRRLRRSQADAYRAWEQACRQRWRALYLVVRAKLEAVESGITTFQDEFLAHIVLPQGGTVGEWLSPQLGQAYATGKMPPLLPAPKEPHG